MRKSNYWIAALAAAISVALVQAARKAWEKYTYHGRVSATKRKVYATEKKIRKNPWYVDMTQARYNPYADGDSAGAMLYQMDVDMLEDARLDYADALVSLRRQQQTRAQKRDSHKLTRGTKRKVGQLLHRKSTTGKDADTGTDATDTNAA